MTSTLAVASIAVIALGGVVVRPWNSPELLWAAGGALLLVLAGLLPMADAGRAIATGLDVYFFLVGMMLLSAAAEREGLFDQLAAICARQARGSASRLFALVYLAGVLVTVFLSNDATAVVLTPAVLAVCRKAKVDEPLPYLLVCALIANAASFVLPISNPANLVLFGDRLPHLGAWLRSFSLPSLLSIVATFGVLRWRSRGALVEPVATEVDLPGLASTGWLAAVGIALTAVALTAASAAGLDLGAPTFAAGALTAAAVWLVKRESPVATLRHVSWSILPLVAGLFVIVAALQRIGLVDLLSGLVRHAAAAGPMSTAWAAGGIVAFVCNLMNNLPAGLVAGSVLAAADADTTVRSAVAIGVDLGPNLSITGSLATILWLIALRRGGVDIGAWTFLRTGAVAMPVALAAALGGLWLQRVLGA